MRDSNKKRGDNRHPVPIIHPQVMGVAGTNSDDNASGTTVHYYINDHLSTPQRLVDQNGDVMWEATYEAFGAATITTETITQNHRFPGQYFDQESGLVYNWNRYYDPELGRYVTSDPIGLGGGINTFGYVGGNPLMRTDFSGLFFKAPVIIPRPPIVIPKPKVPSPQPIPPRAGDPVPEFPFTPFPSPDRGRGNQDPIKNPVTITQEKIVKVIVYLALSHFVGKLMSQVMEVTYILIVMSIFKIPKHVCAVLEEEVILVGIYKLLL